MATEPLTPVAKLRALLLKEHEMVVCPGVYDGLTARLALKAGFETLYMVLTLLSPDFHI
jgi:2-methylisocitrate lyase-like PEP mutase family enzyme